MAKTARDEAATLGVHASGLPKAEDQSRWLR
jgi:hypothetical protein